MAGNNTIVTVGDDATGAGGLSGAHESVELSIVMPCLNEVRTLGACVRKAGSFLRRTGVTGEIVVADNGSTDGSVELAHQLGVRVVHAAERGYGVAVAAGIEAARGAYIVMGDSDDSYDFRALDGFLERLREGYDLVMGNRFAGGIRPGAMPLLNRYLGNPLISGVGRTLFKSPCRDFYCGLRGLRKHAWRRMALRSQGMDLALEMVVKAAILNLRVVEVPTTLQPDGRGRPPHLRRWRDGWRSLRLLVRMSPRRVRRLGGRCEAVQTGAAISECRGRDGAG